MMISAFQQPEYRDSVKSVISAKGSNIVDSAVDRTIRTYQMHLATQGFPSWRPAFTGIDSCPTFIAKYYALVYLIHGSCKQSMLSAKGYQISNRCIDRSIRGNEAIKGLEILNLLATFPFSCYHFWRTISNLLQSLELRVRPHLLRSLPLSFTLLWVLTPLSCNGLSCVLAYKRISIGFPDAFYTSLHLLRGILNASGSFASIRAIREIFAPIDQIDKTPLIDKGVLLIYKLSNLLLDDLSTLTPNLTNGITFIGFYVSSRFSFVAIHAICIAFAYVENSISEGINEGVDIETLGYTVHAVRSSISYRTDLAALAMLPGLNNFP